MVSTCRSGYWGAPADVKQDFRNASILKDGRTVFDMAGNKYPLVVWFNYAYRVVYIRFLGTHAQYDNIDVQTIVKMTWKLHEGLGIPAESLIKPPQAHF